MGAQRAETNESIPYSVDDVAEGNPTAYGPALVPPELDAVPLSDDVSPTRLTPEQKALRTEMREREGILLKLVKTYASHPFVLRVQYEYRTPGPANWSQNATDDFLTEIAHYPILTDEQERALLQKLDDAVALHKMLKDPDLRAISGMQEVLFVEAVAAHQVLVLANQRLVASIAKKYIGLSDLDLLDLISEGNIGLAKGVRRMIPRLGNRLSTVAILWLKQNMTRMMRQTGHAIRLPDNLQTAVHAFKNAEAALEQQSGDSPNDEEIAGATGKDVEKTKQLRALADIVVFSLNTPAEGEGSEVGDFMTDESADPAERLDALSAALWVEEVLEIELRPDEREMVRRRFGIGDEDDRPMSLRELGKHAGVSGELIRLRLAKAIAAIREYNQDPDSLAD